MILLSFLGIIPQLDSIRRYTNEQLFSLRFQTRSPLSSCPKRSSADHSLAMSSLVRLAPITYFPISSKFFGFLDGLSVGVRKSSPASRLLSWTKIRIFQAFPQGASLVRSYRVANMGLYDPFWYLAISFGDRCPIEPFLMGAEGSNRAS